MLASLAFSEEPLALRLAARALWRKYTSNELEYIGVIREDVPLALPPSFGRLASFTSGAYKTTDQMISGPRSL